MVAHRRAPTRSLSAQDHLPSPATTSITGSAPSVAAAASNAALGGLAGAPPLPVLSYTLPEGDCSATADLYTLGQTRAEGLGIAGLSSIAGGDAAGQTGTMRPGMVGRSFSEGRQQRAMSISSSTAPRSQFTTPQRSSQQFTNSVDLRPIPLSSSNLLRVNPTVRHPPPPTGLRAAARRILAVVSSMLPNSVAQTLPQFSPEISYGYPPVSPSLLRPRPVPPTVVAGRARRRRKAKRAMLVLVVLGGLLMVAWRVRGSELDVLSAVVVKRNDPRPSFAVVAVSQEAKGPLAPLHFIDGDEPSSRKTPLDKIFTPNADAPLLPTHPEPAVLLDRRSARQSKEKEEARKRKKAATYKRLLPMTGVPRRRKYGANFQPAHEDDEQEGAAPSNKEGLAAPEGNVDSTNLAVDALPSPELLETWFEEGKEKYEREADDWRAFEWEVPAPHSSLQQAVKTLNEDELLLRDWIRRVHLLPEASGVGLASGQDSSIPEMDVEVGEIPLLVTDDGEVVGDESKWDQLRIEARGEMGAGKCAGATWLEDYRQMQEEMLSGEREPKFISYHCERGMNCGGLGDRILGMTSAFYIGLMTNRAFLAEWQTPVPLDVIFDSPNVNWSYSSFTAADHPVLGQSDLVSASADLDIVHFDRLAMDMVFGSATWNPPAGHALTPGLERRDLAYQSPWIKFFSNRGLIRRSFRWPHLRKKIRRHGLQPHSAFACISRFLFRPKATSMGLITEYTSILALPTVFSVGIQIRTGDLSMKDAEYDKKNTVELHNAFFKCAADLAVTYASPSQQVIYYLVTDSAHLKQDAQAVLGDKLVITDTVPQHVHQKSGHVDGVLGAVVEDYILAKTDYRVITQDSGFGKLASFSSAKESSTVTIFPQFNPDVIRRQSKNSHVKVDCTLPEALTSFEDISGEWSLG